MRNPKKQTTIAVILSIFMVFFLMADKVHAHCDTLNGPVVADARKAIALGDVTSLLKWVAADDEQIIRSAFQKTLEVRKLGTQARDLADMYFFETLVRIHRAGEGAPYTGLKPGTVVALAGAPENFDKVLGELPEGATLRMQNRGNRDLTLWFPKTKAEMEQRLERMATFAEGGGLWIIWPKKSSGVVSDLSQTVVRKSGLDADLVDFKICSIDKTWSGLRFTQRKG